MVEKGLLGIWGRLGEYCGFLVVIGGLVPRYITAPDGTFDYDEMILPRNTSRKFWSAYGDILWISLTSDQQPTLTSAASLTRGLWPFPLFRVI